MNYPDLNPFNWLIYGAIFISLIVFYLLGQSIFSRLSNPFLSIGARMTIGMLFTVSVLATIYTRGESGMVFYLALFVVMALRRRAKPDFEDVKQLSSGRIVSLVLLIAALVTVESYRGNVIQDGGVYVGNSDIAHYASYGHAMFTNGIETSAETTTPTRTPSLYHFGDLWFSGIYSYFLGIIPYYAYILVVRNLMLIMIMLMVYGWARELKVGRLLSGVACFIFLFAVYLEFFNLDLGETSLLQLFTFYYPAYCNPSHMIIALGAIPFFLLRTKGNESLAIIGLWLLPFLNGGILVVPIVASISYSVYHFGRALKDRSLETRTVLNHMAYLLVAITPLLYYKLTGRMFDSSGVEISGHQLYLSVHTAIRALISYVFILPYLFGLWYFARIQDNNSKDIFVLSVAILIGTWVSFSVIFPIIQGNSVKILSLHFTGILVPIMAIGLVGLVQFGVGRIRVIASLSVLLILIQTIRVAANTNVYALTFDWGVYIDSYRNQTIIPSDSYDKLRVGFSEAGGNIGYYRFNKEREYGGVHYTRFTPLKAVFPGTVFYRMNVSEKDTMCSEEQLEYFKLTSLGYFAFQNDFDSSKVSDEMLEYLKPQLIIRPKGGDYVFPLTLSETYKDSIDLGDYVIYKK